MNSTEIKSSVYEIKINRKWLKVRATSMIALNNWAKENNVSDWRMVGMMSISETKGYIVTGKQIGRAHV